MRATSTPWRRHNLPPPETTRWVASRKATVVIALKKALVTRDYVIELYALSDEELDGWIRNFETHGEQALCVTKITTYRRTDG